MSKARILSRKFMASHPRCNQDTYFVEKALTSLGIDYVSHDYFVLLLNINPKITELEIYKFYHSLSTHLPPKHHTIRGGSHFKAKDKISLRVWSGKPYKSKQIVIAPDIEVKKVWSVVVEKDLVRNADDSTTVITKISIDGKHQTSNYEKLAANDGLSVDELCEWFNKPMTGQIICWNDKIEY